MILLLLSTVAVLWSPCQSQDLHALRQKMAEREAHLAAMEQFPNFREDVVKAMAMIEDLWTVHFPKLLESESLFNISQECVNSTKSIIFKHNVTMPELLPLIDATGKQGAGLLTGNLVLDAAFDECFNYNYTGFCMGKVDLSFISSSIPLSWTAGLCVPKHCTPRDIAIVLNATVVFRVDEEKFACTDAKFPAYSPGSIVMILVCLLFALLVALGTVMDKILEWVGYSSHEQDPLAINNSDSSGLGVSGTGERVPLLSHVAREKQTKVRLHEFITAFSLYKTLPTLLATKQAASVITSLNGLRVMSMFWVILGHVYVWISIGAVTADNSLEIKLLLERFTFQSVENAFFAVDSFFFLSGVLVAYLTFRQMKKTGRFPFLHYYVHRYLRLTPAYAFVLFFAWSLSQYIAAGPVLSMGNGYSGACSKYWWTNLLYINNLYPWNMAKQCIGWSWYLANDMQFFVIAPLILIPMYYLFPVGLVMSSVMLAGSFLITATLSGVFDFQGGIFASIAYGYVPNPNITVSYMDVIYEKPWSRISPYIVGLLLGYVLYKGVRLPFNRKISAPVYLAIWMVSGFLLASTTYGLYFTWHGHVPTRAENVVYITFSRFAWGIGLALLVFACHNGYGGLINTFLSMKIWTPLSRMTFNAYLVHPIVLTIVYGQLQKSIHVTDITMATFSVAMIAFSYTIGGLLCLFVEFPLGSVEMLLFKLVGLDPRMETQRQGTIKDKGEKTIA